MSDSSSTSSFVFDEKASEKLASLASSSSTSQAELMHHAMPERGLAPFGHSGSRARRSGR